MKPDTDILTLSYSAPKILFSGAARYRSRQSKFVIVFGLYGTIFCIIFALLGRTSMPPIVHAGTALLGCFFLAIAVFYSWGWIANREVWLKLTEEGITYGRRSWRWERIGEVGGTRYSDGVQLYFKLRKTARQTRPTKRLINIQGERIYDVGITPGISEDQFRVLTTELIQFLGERFAHVHVECTLCTPPPPMSS